MSFYNAQKDLRYPPVSSEAIFTLGDPHDHGEDENPHAHPVKAVPFAAGHLRAHL